MNLFDAEKLGRVAKGGERTKASSPLDLGALRNEVEVGLQSARSGVVVSAARRRKREDRKEKAGRKGRDRRSAPVAEANSDDQIKQALTRWLRRL